MDASEAGRQIVERAVAENGISDFDELVRECRSYRRFDATDPVGPEFLTALVGIARNCASAMNQQALRFRVVADAASRDVVFANVRFASALADWDGPEPHERPSGYVVICRKGAPSDLKLIDCGIAAQTMALAATDAGYGCCMLRSFPPTLGADLGIEGDCEPVLVLGFGRPAERVVLDVVGEEHGQAYWRDADDVHHVPKLDLADLLV